MKKDFQSKNTADCGVTPKQRPEEPRGTQPNSLTGTSRTSLLTKINVPSYRVID